MIAALICRSENGDWVIDTWVMSCRVLGRGVEQAVLNRLVEEAHAAGIRRLIGIYRPTERNGLVSEHYAKLGFASLPTGDGERWTLDLADYGPREVPIVIKCDPDVF